MASQFQFLIKSDSGNLSFPVTRSMLMLLNEHQYLLKPSGEIVHQGKRSDGKKAAPGNCRLSLVCFPATNPNLTIGVKSLASVVITGFSSKMDGDHLVFTKL